MFRVLGTCVLGLLLGSTAVTAQEERFLVTRLAPDLLMLGTDQGQYSNNSLVFTGPDGVLLVDTHDAEDAAALRAYVEGLGLGTPKYIINTHRHIEHIGGNAAFGPAPVIVAHRLLPEKLRRGTFLFCEFPPEAFPDVTFVDSLVIRFNGETIRLVAIGGSHDDNEILVHFTRHGVAHVSSVVNGFNFPSVDRDGNALGFAAQTRRLMKLLPRDVRLVSGHNGRASGFDFVGRWEQLPAYADMMDETVDRVRQALAAGRSAGEMKAAGLLDGFARYAGSYVDAAGWIDTLVEALTQSRDTRQDICGPVYETWKTSGARAAVRHYRSLIENQAAEFNGGEQTLLAIGSKLFTREMYGDADEFLTGCLEIYPGAEYAYYAHYLAARCCQELERTDEAVRHCRESLRLQDGFAPAATLLSEIEAAAK